MNQENKRRIIIISATMPSLLYILFGFILAFISEDAQFTDPKISLVVLVGGCLIALLFCVLYIHKNWNADENITAQEQIRKDILSIAAFQLFSFIAMVYFILSFLGVL